MFDNEKLTLSMASFGISANFASPSYKIIHIYHLIEETKQNKK